MCQKSARVAHHQVVVGQKVPTQDRVLNLDTDKIMNKQLSSKERLHCPGAKGGDTASVGTCQLDAAAEDLLLLLVGPFDVDKEGGLSFILGQFSCPLLVKNLLHAEGDSCLPCRSLLGAPGGLSCL